MKKGLFILMPVFFLIALLVVPVSAATIPYDETVEIDAFSYYNISFTPDELGGEGTELSISVEVVSGTDISFFIIETQYFAEWVRGVSVLRHAVREDVTSASIKWTVPTKIGWTVFIFVLDNTDNGEKVTVHLTIAEATGVCLGTLLIAAIPIVALVILGKSVLQKSWRHKS